MQDSSQGSDLSSRGSFYQFTATWGLYMGLLVSVLTVLTVGLRIVDYAWALTLLELLVYFLMAGRAMSLYRRSLSKGYITYGTAFKVGAMQSLFSAIIVVAIYFVMIEVVVPDYPEFLYQETLKVMRQSVTDVDQLEQVMQKNPIFHLLRSPLFHTFSTLFNSITYGLIASLIMAIFIKRVPQTRNI